VASFQFQQFEIVIDRPEAVLRSKLARSLAARDCTCVGWVQSAHAELRVPKLERHFWSPRLQLSFDSLTPGKGNTRVLGSFRPEPGVWTGLLFIHCLLGGLATAGLSLGLAQWTLGDPPTAMFATLLGVALSVSLYVATLAGARRGYDQRHMLRRELDRALRW
jgi:hypothetical protein